MATKHDFAERYKAELEKISEELQKKYGFDEQNYKEKCCMEFDKQVFVETLGKERYQEILDISSKIRSGLKQGIVSFRNMEIFRFIYGKAETAKKSKESNDKEVIELFDYEIIWANLENERPAVSLVCELVEKWMNKTKKYEGHVKEFLLCKTKEAEAEKDSIIEEYEKGQDEIYHLISCLMKFMVKDVFPQENFWRIVFDEKEMKKSISSRR